MGNKMTNYRYNKGGRNFGYGKQLNYAVKHLLKDKYGEGKYATRAAHEARFKYVVKFLKHEGIKDLKKIDLDSMKQLGSTLNRAVTQGTMSVAYAQNVLSTCNVVLSHARGDNRLRMSPAKEVGKRSHVRQELPKSLCRSTLSRSVQNITDLRVRSSVMLAREFGLRFKETALLNLNRALKEATALGQFNVIEGTKGGRSAPRWISVSAKQLNVLKDAKLASGRFKNLVGRVGSFKGWQNQFANDYRHSGLRDSVGKFHDLRAAYACELYEQLTGKPAPVVTGSRTASYLADQQARAEIAHKLGHNRIDVVNTYVGRA
jgi:hypothetical protein